MKSFSLKNIAIILVSTLLLSGLAYAVTTITSLNQTVATDDIISASWFNDVKNRITALETKVNIGGSGGGPVSSLVSIQSASFATKQEFSNAVYNHWKRDWSEEKAIEQKNWCSEWSNAISSLCWSWACTNKLGKETSLSQISSGCLDSSLPIWATGSDEEISQCIGKPWIAFNCYTTN